MSRSTSPVDPFAEEACQLVPDDDACQVSGSDSDDSLELDHDVSLQPAPTGRKPAARSAGLAAMSEKLAALASPPVELTPGQRVRHAEYGEGVLEKIGGTGPRMVGTVLFDGTAGRRTFILSHATLEPLG